MSALTFLPGNLWVLSHRCYGNKPLLENEVDRRRWMYWLFQSRRLYGLSVLNYVVLPNEVKLLVMDRRRGEIRLSMRFLAERMAKDYKRLHQRRQPLWEAEYQATRVEFGDDNLRHCMTDMDLTVVRAKLAAHPKRWPTGGFHELLNPPKRVRRVDFTLLQRLLNPISFSKLQNQRERWVKQALKVVASDAIYAPHPSMVSIPHRVSKNQCLSLPITTQQVFLPVAGAVGKGGAARELVPKRYIT